MPPLRARHAGRWSLGAGSGGSALLRRREVKHLPRVGGARCARRRQSRGSRQAPAPTPPIRARVATRGIFVFRSSPLPRPPCARPQASPAHRTRARAALCSPAQAVLAWHFAAMRAQRARSPSRSGRAAAFLRARARALARGGAHLGDEPLRARRVQLQPCRMQRSAQRARADPPANGRARRVRDERSGERCVVRRHCAPRAVLAASEADADAAAARGPNARARAGQGGGRFCS